MTSLREYLQNYKEEEPEERKKEPFKPPPPPVHVPDDISTNKPKTRAAIIIETGQDIVVYKMGRHWVDVKDAWNILTPDQLEFKEEDS